LLFFILGLHSTNTDELKAIEVEKKRKKRREKEKEIEEKK